MKKLLFSLSLLASVAYFSACSTDVELYADYKDIPVVYGLLDASVDTNFIRINRAFSGSNDHPINANEVALIADSCNYPGKLNAYIVKYRSSYGNTYTPTGDTMFLDTLTLHDKEEGLFYSPSQKVYFTDQHLDINTGNTKYKYKLCICKDNDTVTSETALVGGQDFRIVTYTLSFSPEDNGNTSKVKFTAADNAVFYDVKMVFNYKESINGGPMVDKSVSYSFGNHSIEEMPMENGFSYYVTYSDNVLFNLLETVIGGDTVVDPNHPNVVRSFDEWPMLITVSGGGDELYNYIKVNSQTGYSQSIPDYSNVSGGYGVFSSKINLTQSAKLSSGAQRALYAKPWGFVQQ